MLSVSVTSIGYHKAVAEKAPELLPAVEAGEISLKAAAEEARHPESFEDDRPPPTEKRPTRAERMIARKAERKAARAAKPKLTAQEKVAKSSASYMEHLHDAFRSSGQTRAKLIDQWWSDLTEEGRQRFYDDKIAPWLEARGGKRKAMG